MLTATAASQIILVNPGNLVGGFAAQASGGGVSFDDDSADALNVGDVSAAAGVGLVNAAGGCLSTVPSRAGLWRTWR